FISPKLALINTKEQGNSIYSTDKIFKNELLISIPSKYNLNFITILAFLRKFNSDPQSFVIFGTPKYDEVLRSQEDLELGNDSIYTDLYKKLTYDELIQLSSFQLVSFFLTIEFKRGIESWWQPFFDVLPGLEDFSNIPFTWLINGDDDYFEKLPLTARDHSLKQFNKFNKDFKSLCELIDSKIDNDIERYLPKDLFLRFWLCCNSRCLYMKLDEKLNQKNEDNFTMVPFVDFLNHDVEENCFVKVTNAFKIYSGLIYKPRSQIYLSYGPHSNEFLLCEYGFLLNRNENRWNCIDLSKEILALFEKNPEKIAFLKKIDYYDNYFITTTDISFRIEIALAVLSEKDINSKNLKLFIEGMTDGSHYRKERTKILSNLLNKTIEDCK
ncbi:hypothetical protein PACTADRAFT_21700, partial [Pachysolen tannophilus NRRL Y-2460]